MKIYKHNSTNLLLNYFGKDYNNFKFKYPLINSDKNNILYPTFISNEINYGQIVNHFNYHNLGQFYQYKGDYKAIAEATSTTSLSEESFKVIYARNDTSSRQYEESRDKCKINGRIYEYLNTTIADSDDRVSPNDVRGLNTLLIHDMVNNYKPSLHIDENLLKVFSIVPTSGTVSNTINSNNTFLYEYYTAQTDLILNRQFILSLLGNNFKSYFNSFENECTNSNDMQTLSSIMSRRVDNFSNITNFKSDTVMISGATNFAYTGSDIIFLNNLYNTAATNIFISQNAHTIPLDFDVLIREARFLSYNGLTFVKSADTDIPNNDLIFNTHRMNVDGTTRAEANFRTLDSTVVQSKDELPNNFSYNLGFSKEHTKGDTENEVFFPLVEKKDIIGFNVKRTAIENKIFFENVEYIEGLTLQIQFSKLYNELLIEINKDIQKPLIQIYDGRFFISDIELFFKDEDNNIFNPFDRIDVNDYLLQVKRVQNTFELHINEYVANVIVEQNQLATFLAHYNLKLYGMFCLERIKLFDTQLLIEDINILEGHSLDFEEYVPAVLEDANQYVNYISHLNEIYIKSENYISGKHSDTISHLKYIKTIDIRYPNTPLNLLFDIQPNNSYYGNYPQCVVFIIKDTDRIQISYNNNYHRYTVFDVNNTVIFDTANLGGSNNYKLEYIEKNSRIVAKYNWYQVQSPQTLQLILNDIGSYRIYTYGVTDTNPSFTYNIELTGLLESNILTDYNKCKLYVNMHYPLNNIQSTHIFNKNPIHINEYYNKEFKLTDNISSFQFKNTALFIDQFYNIKVQEPFIDLLLLYCDKYSLDPATYIDEFETINSNTVNPLLIYNKNHLENRKHKIYNINIDNEMHSNLYPYNVRFNPVLRIKSNTNNTEYIYSFGGSDGLTSRNEIYKAEIGLDGKLKSFNSTGINLPAASNMHNVILINNIIYLFNSINNPLNIYKSTVDDNGNIAAFTLLSNKLPEAILNQSYVLIDNAILLLGGYYHIDNSPCNKIFKILLDNNANITSISTLSVETPSPSLSNNTVVINDTLYYFDQFGDIYKSKIVNSNIFEFEYYKPYFNEYIPYFSKNIILTENKIILHINGLLYQAEYDNDTSEIDTFYPVNQYADNQQYISTTLFCTNKCIYSMGGVYYDENDEIKYTNRLTYHLIDGWDIVDNTNTKIIKKNRNFLNQRNYTHIKIISYDDIEVQIMTENDLIHKKLLDKTTIFKLQDIIDNEIRFRSLRQGIHQTKSELTLRLFDYESYIDPETNEIINVTHESEDVIIPVFHNMYYDTRKLQILNNSKRDKQHFEILDEDYIFFKYNANLKIKSNNFKNDTFNIKDYVINNEDLETLVCNDTDYRSLYMLMYDYNYIEEIYDDIDDGEGNLVNTLVDEIERVEKYSIVFSGVPDYFDVYLLQIIEVKYEYPQDDLIEYVTETVTEYETITQEVPKLDDEGNPEFDSEGNPIMVEEEIQIPKEVEITTEIRTPQDPIIEYKKEFKFVDKILKTVRKPIPINEKCNSEFLCLIYDKDQKMKVRRLSCTNKLELFETNIQNEFNTRIYANHFDYVEPEYEDELLINIYKIGYTLRLYVSTKYRVLPGNIKKEDNLTYVYNIVEDIYINDLNIQKITDSENDINKDLYFAENQFRITGTIENLFKDKLDSRMIQMIVADNSKRVLIFKGMEEVQESFEDNDGNTITETNLIPIIENPSTTNNRYIITTDEEGKFDIQIIIDDSEYNIDSDRIQFIRGLLLFKAFEIQANPVYEIKEDIMREI